MINVRISLAVLVALFAASGCQSTQQQLQQSQAQAVSVAVKRAQFEFNCPEATGSVLSSEMVQPPVMAPRLGGVERAEYTIGVSGCDKRQTYVVVCPQDGSGGCFAAEGNN